MTNNKSYMGFYKNPFLNPLPGAKNRISIYTDFLPCHNSCQIQHTI